jgi:hypothetical protein
MMVSAAGVGADFRVEGGIEPRETAAEPDYHIGDDVIRSNAQPLAGDLKRQVSVAKMPSDPQQVRPIDRLDFEKRLRRRANAEISAGVELKSIAVDEAMRPRQIEKKGLSRIGDEADAATMPVDVSEGDRTERGVFRPIAPAVDREGSPHRPRQYKK